MSSTAKFERLIALIINEDREKASALFHDIVVEKSREIYESIMDEDQTSGLVDEVSAEEEGMDGMMEDDEFIDDEEMDGDFDVDGEDDDEEMGDDFGDEDETEVDIDVDDMDDEEEEAEIEDRVVDLEDKLDELMAEFEEMMGDKDEDMGDEDMGDEDMGDEDMGDEEAGIMENVELKKVPGLYDSKISQDYADGSKKGPVDANSGQKGMASRPVNFDQGGTATASGTKAPSVKNYGTTGEKEVKDAGKWNNRAGANPTIARSGKGDAAGMQYGSPQNRAQGKEVGDGGTVKQDNKSVIESRRTTKRRI